MSFDQWELFKVDVSDFVATVKISAPPVNAQNRKFRTEIVEVFDVLGNSDDVRSIVLVGDGKLFSAGADFSERKGIMDLVGGYANHNRLVRASFDAVLECPKPVIAAVGGGAIGAGCVLALVCDVLIVSEKAYFAMTEVNFGMAGGVSYVSRALGASNARMMIYTGRRIPGADLYRMNVATECVPDDKLEATATELALEIAGKSPLAIAAAKRSFAMVQEMSLRDGYRYEQSQTAILSKSDDAIEAQAAFLEKRPPKFK